MKILFINCYSDACWHLNHVVSYGMTELLKNDFCEFPFIKMHHKQDGDSHFWGTRDLWDSYAYNLDGRYLKELKKSDLDEFDFIMLNPLHPYDDNTSYNSELVKQIFNNDYKKIFIDGFDQIYTVDITKNVNYYFKSAILDKGIYLNSQYLEQYHSYERTRDSNNDNKDADGFPIYDNVYPLNITIIPNKNTDSLEKIYDVSFTLRSNSSYRKTIKEILIKYLKEHPKLKGYILNDFLTHDEYVKIIKQSKVSISIEGIGSPHDVRYWEIPYYGTCLLSHVPPIKIDDNFENKKNCVFFNNIENFIPNLEYAIENWEEISKNGKEHILEYHMPINRARKILNIIGR